MHAVQRLEEETRHLRGDAEAERSALLDATTSADYVRYLSRAYGFIAPLERCLLDTPGLTAYLDPKRLQKHLLIEHDLQALGSRQLDVQAIPQCMWIPWFEDPWCALGWAFVIERNTLEFPQLFRHLATALPGEAAFAASYLKLYAGAAGEMWKSFSNILELASVSPRHLERMVSSAASAYRSLRRWRNTLDGKSLSSPCDQIVNSSFDDELGTSSSSGAEQS
jgi:heme oxygenase